MNVFSSGGSYAGFRLEKVGAAPERTKYIGLGFQAKRCQYGLRHRIAATIHAAMGQDLSAIVTKVDGGKDYELFQREQVVVLLSRTHFAKDIIFVGEPEATATALWKALDDTSQYSQYMEHLLSRLLDRPGGVGLGAVDVAREHPFRPIDFSLPTDNSGYAYVLASASASAQGRVTYIGQAQNLALRYEQHKRGTGPEATREPSMGPWVMLGYVAGFEGCHRSVRLFFEALWQACRDRENTMRGNNPMNANQVADLGEQILLQGLHKTNYVLESKNLVFVRCGIMLSPDEAREREAADSAG